MRKIFALLLFALFICSSIGFAAAPDPAKWHYVLTSSKNISYYFQISDLEKAKEIYQKDPEYSGYKIWVFRTYSNGSSDETLYEFDRVGHKRSRMLISKIYDDNGKMIHYYDHDEIPAWTDLIPRTVGMKLYDTMTMWVTAK